jgi:cytochrome P450
MLLVIVLITSLLLSLTYLITKCIAISPSLPGPFLARFTDLWRAYQQYNGQLRSKLTTLHAKHGLVVRYGISSVSVSDPKAIDILYGSRAGFVIADSYQTLVGISNGKEVPSLVSTRDETRHGQLRRSVASAFTVRGSEDYEVFVDSTIPDLLDAVRRSKGGKFDLPGLLMLYSMDSASRMAFSESLGCLKSGEDVGGSIALIRDRLEHWGYWSSLPWLERLIYRNPWATGQSKGKTPSAMVSTATQKLKIRMASKEGGDGRDMLNKFIHAHHTNPDTIDAQGIISLLMSTITGAGDTTAATMTATMFYLLRNPAPLEKLRKELQDAGLSNDEVPPYTQTSKLPYLAAVIKESMRLFPVQTWPLERLVPFGGINIAGHFIQAGTSVGIFVPALHRDQHVFGTDVESFRPERWLDTDMERVKKMEQTFMGFSRGRRVCLGQHVAVMQMKKVVPALIMSFDLNFVDAKAPLDAEMSSAVVCLKPLWVVAKERQ